MAAVLGKTKDGKQRDQILLNTEKILFRNQVPGIGVIDERRFADFARDMYNNKEEPAVANKKLEDIVNTAVSVTNIIQSFKYLFTYERGEKGFHRWRCLKYFLFEYEAHLKLMANETNDKVTLDDFNETTIEHIIPQKYSDNWQDIVDSVTNGLKEGDNIEKTKVVLINTIGNLTILKNGKNASLGNKGWKEKRERFRTGSYNEIEISRHEEWTKNSVAQRGVEMLRFLEQKVTGLNFTGNEIKNTLYFDEYIAELIDS